MSNTHLSSKRFDSLGLPEKVLQGIHDAGFTFCTPIQAETLDLALSGHDVAGQAQTGTGKTAAFLIAMFNFLLKNPSDTRRTVNQPRAIVLAPTRELAIQIKTEAELLGRYSGMAIGVVYGGEAYDAQKRMLEAGLDILIGTPGRLIDYQKQRLIDLRGIEVAVLDEADRMFDLGFIRDIRYLLRRMPKPEQRLTMLFSATLSYRATELSYEHMNNPVLIRIEPDKATADNVTQSIFYTSNEEKIPLLVGLLRHSDATRTIVFVNTKDSGRMVSAYLNGNGLNAGILSGDVPQKKRIKLLVQFQKGELPILVATDVAARGLHIPDVSHVINYDLPQDPEDYVHRIGRTARAGASGDAISFACEEYAFSLPDIERYLGHKIPSRSVDEQLLVKLEAPVYDTSLPARRRPDRSRGGGASKPPSRRRRNRTSGSKRSAKAR